jgi:hypothetical protein
MVASWLFWERSGRRFYYGFAKQCHDPQVGSNGGVMQLLLGNSGCCSRLEELLA